MKLVSTRIALIAAAALLGAGCASAPTGPAALDLELARIATDPRHPLSSLSVAAVRDGKLAYTGHFGKRSIAADRPVEERTLYRVASVSKVVVAIGVMRLVDEGRLTLDEDVSRWLGFPLRNPRFPDVPITLRMLLTHRSSLRDDAFYFWPASRALRDVVLPGGSLHGEGAMWARDHPPGMWFRYANLNWGVIGTVMEGATGERFDRLMKRLVLEPLGLRGGFNPAELAPAELADLATLYSRSKEVGGKDVWDPAGPWIAQHDDYSRQPPAPRADASYRIGSNGTVFGPQGNLRISAADLARVMVMLMDGGLHEGRRFLSRESVAALLSTQWRHDGRNGVPAYDGRGRFYAWGLGLQHFLDIPGAGTGDRLVDGGGLHGSGHLGEAYGLTAIFAFDPVRRAGVVCIVGGTGFDPATQPGQYSSLLRHEERLLTAIHRHVLR